MTPTDQHHRLPRRELQLILVVDVSGSMAPDGKMPSLNTAVEEALPHLRRVAADAPGVSVFVRVLCFGSAAHWSAAPVPIESFRWDELTAEPAGLTELGLAIDAIASQLPEVDPGAAVPPAILLVSDGLPTDINPPSFDQALARLDTEPLGRAAARMAVGIGRDADLELLQRFIGSRGGRPVRADSPQQLMVQVRDQISAAVQSASELAP